MAETSIEWTDFTFNAWIGCAKVSPGCQNCYAAQMAHHRSNWGAIWGIKGTRVRTSANTWRNPIKWNREAEHMGKRARVFCSSLADVFEDRRDLIPFRKDLFELIKITPWLDWLLLTKRPENIERLLPQGWHDGWENVWLGTSAEDQERYDLRVNKLLAVKAKIHFISAEPLLGPITLSHSVRDGLDWIIVGGESGSRFREMDLDWARKLRDDASKRGITFFFKQHSAYRPKTKGKLLDGKMHHKWPDNGSVPRRLGRPKTSPLSRQEQLRLAQQKYRKTHIFLPAFETHYLPTHSKGYND